MAGRPRTPTNVLDAKGAFKKNPQRKRDNEPTVDSPFPRKPPARLNENQKEAWTEVVNLVPDGVLTAADVLHVEIVACLLSQFWESEGYMPTDRITRLTSEMGKLGLNPSARASLVVAKPKTNDFDDI